MGQAAGAARADPPRPGQLGLLREARVVRGGGVLLRSGAEPGDRRGRDGGPWGSNADASAASRDAELLGPTLEVAVADHGLSDSLVVAPSAKSREPLPSRETAHRSPGGRRVRVPGPPL